MRNYTRLWSAGRGSIMKHDRSDVTLYAILDGEGHGVSLIIGGGGWWWDYDKDSERGPWEWVYVAPKRRKT